MDIVVLATADWDNPLWTNKQHLASRWGALGHRVLYVESLGLRRPGLGRRDVSRMMRRLRRANRTRQVQEGVWILSPLALPFHGSRLARVLNRRWLARLVRSCMRRLRMSDAVLWTYNPLALDYLGDLEWNLIGYHCVDELAGAPGMPVRVVQERERHLMARCDVVVTSAATLAEAKRPHARRIEYFPNPADFERFHAASDGSGYTPADLRFIPRPRIGFVGAVSDYKLDLDLLRDVFDRRRDWHLALVGPVGEGQPGTSLAVLRGLPNVHPLGPRPYEEVPDYLRGFDVCLLPNRLNEYTRHMFPLKFFEYLATGKPVAMTRLPALKEFWHLAYVAEPGDGSGMIDAIERALAEPADAEVREARMMEARRHDWNAQAGTTRGRDDS
jgi:glycosyltransferase involved in cell wall biosynthesis